MYEQIIMSDGGQGHMGAAAKPAKYEDSMSPKEWNEATEELIRLSVRSDQASSGQPKTTETNKPKKE